LAGMPPATQRYVSAARVLPMTGYEPIHNGVVALEDTRIVGVGPLAEFQDELAGAPGEHFPDGTLLPGLIDAHAHLTLPANRQSYERMAQDSDELMALVSTLNMHRPLVCGLTTIRDNGCRKRMTIAER